MKLSDLKQGDRAWAYAVIGGKTCRIRVVRTGSDMGGYVLVRCDDAFAVSLDTEIYDVDKRAVTYATDDGSDVDPLKGSGR